MLKELFKSESLNVLQEGLIYGNWDNGPWFGFRSK